MPGDGVGCRSEGKGGRNYKGDKETFGDKGCVHYCGDGFMDVKHNICQSLSDCTLQICSVYYMPIISQ